MHSHKTLLLKNGEQWVKGCQRWKFWCLNKNFDVLILKTSEEQLISERLKVLF